jgi:succinate dehydrogenase assembly factor 1
MVSAKPNLVQPKFRLFVRYTFHLNANLSPRNITFIEHLLRKGRRQIESYEDPAVTDCWVSEEMVAWNATWKRS